MLALLLSTLFVQVRDPTVLSPLLENAAISATKLNQSAWLHALEACEDPSGDPNIHHLDSNGRYSDGVLQFQMGTWLAYSFLGTTKENIYVPVLQEKIAAYVLDHGGERNWLVCSGRVEKQLGPWPETQPAAPL